MRGAEKHIRRVRDGKIEKEGESTKFQFTFKKVPREIEIQAEKLRDLERERKTEREENYRKLREREVESRSHEGEQKVLEGTQEAAIEGEVSTRENAEKMKEVETREIEVLYFFKSSKQYLSIQY